MAPRKRKTTQATPSLPPQLAAVNLHAAGIDIGAEAHFVAVPPSDDPQPVRSFGAFTADLEALAAWLATCGITTVALESTGVYWIPLFELAGDPWLRGASRRSATGPEDPGPTQE